MAEDESSQKAEADQAGSMTIPWAQMQWVIKSPFKNHSLPLPQGKYWPKSSYTVGWVKWYTPHLESQHQKAEARGWLL